MDGRIESSSPGVVPLHDVDELVAVLAAGEGAFDTPADDPHREQVDLLQHALQCADELARRRPNDVELQVAGLLHDIGHHVAPGDEAGHGRRGAEMVRPLLGERVARLVEQHVPAKRYLVTVDPQYHAVLSGVSIRSLNEQGGAMTPDELSAHERLPDWHDAVELRRADDAAKARGRTAPGLEQWIPVLRRLAAAHTNAHPA